jgi:uncharacterized SAM-binding protein YcdF (DUF218 family)
MVLPGDQNTRPFAAAAVVKMGLAKKVLVPTTASSPQEEDGVLPPTHVVTRRVLALRGVPEEDVAILSAKSSSTFGDAQALRAYLQSKEVDGVLIVTDHFHTRRARWAFKHVLGNEETGITFVSAPTDGFRAERWWETEQGFVLVVGEYLKLGYYLARYSRATQAVAAGALVLVLIRLTVGFGKRKGVKTSASTAPMGRPRPHRPSSSATGSRRVAL